MLGQWERLDEKVETERVNVSVQLRVRDRVCVCVYKICVICGEWVRVDAIDTLEI